jgi:hypothetical protein
LLLKRPSIPHLQDKQAPSRKLVSGPRTFVVTGPPLGPPRVLYGHVTNLRKIQAPDVAVRIRFPPAARYAARIRPRHQAQKLRHPKWQSAEGVVARAVRESSATVSTDLEAADAAVASSNAMGLIGKRLNYRSILTGLRM